MKAIPNLDEIATDPAVARDLPADVRLALTARAIGVLNALFAAGLADAASGNGPAAHSTDGDRRLKIEEAATRLGVSKAWLYRNARKLPFTVPIGRSLGFSARGIEKYLRQRTCR